MFAALLITLRETLEASLVIGIILAYLNKTDNHSHKRFVWGGVAAGVVLSAILAYVFESYLGGFEGTAEQMYEGVAMSLAAGPLTWMILWMLTQRRNVKANLEAKAHAHIAGDHPWGLFFLVFVSVAREGIETILFLQAAAFQSGTAGILPGGVLGVGLAVGLSYLVFKGFAKVSLRKFFTVTSLLLILFAAGLVAHGVHEFQEAGVLPIFNEHVWDVNNILNERGHVGSFLNGLFGYNGNPSLIESLSYMTYLVFIVGMWKWVDRRKRVV